MIKIKFPDGNVKEYESGITTLQIAESISRGLAKSALAAKFNKKVIDLTRPLTEDGDLEILKWEDDAGKTTFWHSTAHLMAEALEAEFPGVKFGIGPPVENGFYYDIDLGDHHLSPDDLVRIEKKMTDLASQKKEYIRKEIPKKEALDFYTEKGDPYKVELLQELEDGEITFYEQGSFTDLCRGPHIPHTGLIKAIKLTGIAGAYWRGDEKNKQLTRIYGVSFPKKDQLQEYLLMLEEAKKRDHRKIGKEMELFTFDDDVGPGLPLWMPKGTVLIECLEKLAGKTEKEAGYQMVRTPHVAKESMYIKSGHLPYYKESMFPAMEFDGVNYYLKAMNCPHHHKIYDALPRSYRDLPLRLSEYGTCYRNEKSGELFGLMRVRSLQMNDAHIYCSKDQFASEFRAVNEMYMKYFKIFGIDKYIMRFSTHDPEKLGKKYVDMPELWKETEDMVREVLEDTKTPYKEVADEAAFYGPKIDVQIWSAIGREFTLATNQVDFSQPIRFNLTFKNEKNEEETPIIIHRAPLGTHERFIGFLIEHYAGKFPVWLAPEQVIILPISDKSLEYGKKVLNYLKKYDIRTSIDVRGEKIGKKIRDAEVAKTPYMLIIGDKEAENETVSVRRQGQGDQGSLHFEKFAEQVLTEIENYH
ncbi:MAG: threonine--tRNA ligase [Chitinophagaceae bacterium]|nr:MAG: threonine--tRNA ligase [Chitinophagaceae bacterium]